MLFKFAKLVASVKRPFAERRELLKHPSGPDLYSVIVVRIMVGTQMPVLDCGSLWTRGLIARRWGVEGVLAFR